jgi:hypothetical protein
VVMQIAGQSSHSSTVIHHRSVPAAHTPAHLETLAVPPNRQRCRPRAGDADPGRDLRHVHCRADAAVRRRLRLRVAIERQPRAVLAGPKRLASIRAAVRRYRSGHDG